MKVKSQIDLLYKAMARSLNIGENSFSDQFGEQESMRAGSISIQGVLDLILFLDSSLVLTGQVLQFCCKTKKKKDFRFS